MTPQRGRRDGIAATEPNQNQRDVARARARLEPRERAARRVQPAAEVRRARAAQRDGDEPVVIDAAVCVLAPQRARRRRAAAAVVVVVPSSTQTGRCDDHAQQP